MPPSSYKLVGVTRVLSAPTCESVKDLEMYLVPCCSAEYARHLVHLLQIKNTMHQWLTRERPPLSSQPPG